MYLASDPSSHGLGVCKFRRRGRRDAGSHGVTDVIFRVASGPEINFCGPVQKFAPSVLSSTQAVMEAFEGTAIRRRRGAPGRSFDFEFSEDEHEGCARVEGESDGLLRLAEEGMIAEANSIDQCEFPIKFRCQENFCFIKSA